MKKLWLKKKSQIHGDGLYALEDIAKGKKIIEYIGKKINKKEGDRRADRQITRAKKNKKNGMVYVFELNSRYDIDGSFAYNHARLINHSCNPNCEVETINNRLWISSIKNIKKQEELFYNYGYSYDEDYKDHRCKCRSLNCIGYILKKEDWLRSSRAKRNDIK